MKSIVCVLVVIVLLGCESFHLVCMPFKIHRSYAGIARRSDLFVNNVLLPTSELITVGDYAAELERAVGPEIYTPIFRAGLFLFVSGIASALVAAFIISNSDSWDDIETEFQAGKEAQLISNDFENAPINEQKKKLERSGENLVENELKNIDV